MEGIGIDIKLMLDDAALDRNVDKLNKDIRLLKKEVGYLNKELKFDPKNIENLNRKFENLKAQEELAARALKIYKEDLNNLQKQGIISGDAVDQAVLGAEKMQGELLTIQRQMQKCQDQIDQMNNGWNVAANIVDNVGQKAGELADKLAPVSKAAQDFLGGAIDSAIDFQDAFADVQKTVDETSTTSYEELSSGLRELAKQVPVTASDLSHIAGLAGQMGVKADDIVKFTESMVQFGDATNITAEEAVQDIAQIYNVIGRGGDFHDLDQLLSTIVELGNNTATTEKDIVEMFRNVAAASSRVGMTESQMAALAATLSSLGLDKGGASAISKIMTNIDKAVDTGGKSLAEWAEVAGMSAKKFQEVWGADAAAGLLAVVEGIAKSNEEGTSFNQTLEDLGIKEIRQVDTLSRLVNAHENYAENIQMANAAYEEGTALSEEAAKRYQTVASKLKILKNNFMEFALTIGDILLPYVDWFIQSLQGLTEWLNNLGPHTKELITRMLAIVAVMAPLLAGISRLAPLMSGVLRFIGNIRTSLSLLMTVLQPLFTLIGNIGAGIANLVFMHTGWVAAAMAVVAILVTLYNKCDWFRNIVDSAIESVKNLWTEFKETNWIEALGEKFGWFGEIVGALIELFKTLFGWFGNIISKAMEFLGLSGEVSGAIGGLSTSAGRAGSFNVLNSGGFASGGTVTVNNSWTVNGAEVSQQTVMDWADLITDRVNENLGRMV